MRFQRPLNIAAMIAWLGLALTAAAHDTWLSPSTYTASPGDRVAFHLTSGMKFPELDYAIKPERVANGAVRFAGETTELKEFVRAEHALQFERAFTEAGVATVWLQLSPKELELTDDKVAEYLDEIRASEETRRAWAAQKGKQKWQERYTKCAKTCVAIGDAQSDSSWSQPVGLRLEVLPLTNPTTLRRGEEAKFKLLRNGQPLANAAIVLHFKESRDAAFQTTDVEGLVTFRFDKSGAALLSSVYLQPATDGPKWESEFATFSFEVKPIGSP